MTFNAKSDSLHANDFSLVLQCASGRMRLTELSQASAGLVLCSVCPGEPLWPQAPEPRRRQTALRGQARSTIAPDERTASGAPLVVADVGEQAPGVQIDAAVKSVRLVVEAQHGDVLGGDGTESGPSPSRS